MARIQDLKINKITKAKYDQLVSNGTITPDMIANQLWVFTDDMYVSSQNIKDWNAKAEKSDIPTNLSDLKNDTNFITSAAIPTKVSQLSNDSNYATKTEIPKKTSQLTNDSNLAYKSDIPTSLSQLTNDDGYAKTEDIPTRVSQLTNDSNYAKKTEVPSSLSQLTNDTNFANKSDIPVNLSDLNNDLTFASKNDIPTKTSQLTNDSGFLTEVNFTETDPTVPAWAKQASKPTYSKSEVGLGNVDNKSSATIRSEITSSNVTNALGFTPVNPNIVGKASGLATLGTDGKVPTSQLPSYVDDVVEAASKSAFPSTGEAGKIYVAKDTNKTYRWSGTDYIAISSDLALGETSSTAFAGDKGKVAYTHSQSAHAPAGAQANVIENISVNGTNATITNKTAVISVPTKMSQLTNDMGYSVDGSIPTKLSQLENDKGFITSSNLPTKTSQLTNDSGFITSSSLPTKTSQLSNDSGFITSAAVPTKVSQLNNDSGFITSASLPTVPTKTSQLTNDSGFLTNANIPSKTSQLTNDSGFITSSSIPTVPTKVSQLTNDSGFITSAGSITGNAATATTATKTQGTLTIQKNGSSIQTFNGNSSVTANITVPTKVSDLTNDSGFITASGVTKFYVTNMTDLGFTNHAKVSPFDFFKKCYDKFGGGSYIVRFDWADARSAYISSNNYELWINGGEMLVTMNGNPNNGTWLACNAIFLGYDVGYSGIFSSTISSTAGSASGNSLYLFGNTRVITGSGAPASSTGRNGDIYIQT